MLFARTSGFTLIEVMVGMTIFAIGMTGIFVLLQVGIGTAGSARYEVVATNLLREQIELVRNNRDTNYVVYRPWNEACIDADCAKMLTPGTYIVENNFANDIFTYDYTDSKPKTRSVSFKSISPVPTTDVDIFENTKLYIDEKWRYVHTDNGTYSGSIYASYIQIEPIVYSPPSVLPTDQWIVVRAYLLVKDRWIKRYEMASMLTDWRK